LVSSLASTKAPLARRDDSFNYVERDAMRLAPLRDTPVTDAREQLSRPDGI
jgi:hypothetical protein